MGTIDISYLSLGIGLLLLSIPLFYIWKFKTGLLRATLIGTARMIVQLFFIGIYLKYLFLWNMLSSNVIALNTYYSGLKREQQLYRYLLGNGATRTEAQAPFIRQAIIKAFSPLIANISVMGLVAFPGTMIGQILGGSSPNVAIKYQMMIMVITFTASMLSLMITISLASRKSFDAYGKLRQVIVEKKR